MNLSKLAGDASSIKTKLGIYTLTIVFIAFIMAIVLSNRFTTRKFEELYNEQANLIKMHILDDLEQSMLSGRTQWLRNTIDLYSHHEHIKELMIFNIVGRQVFSEQEGQVDPRVQLALDTGKDFHYHKEIDKQVVATYITPIKNKPVCHGCHGATKTLLGALVLSFCTTELKEDITEQNQRYYFLFAFFAVSVIASSFFAVNRFLLKPIKELHQGAQLIGQGDFNYRVPVRCKDEVGHLAESFNHMAQTLKSSFEEIENQRSELAQQYTLVKRSQKEWEETFDTITDQIAVIDRNFNTVKANRAFRQYFSLPLRGEITEKCYEIINTCMSVNCAHKLSMGEEQPLTREVYDTKGKEILQISLFPYYSPDGEVMGSVFIAKDVTEKKETEMRLIMRERLAYLGQIASGIAHELGSPLTTIAGCVSTLRKRISKKLLDPDFFQDYLEMMDEELNRCKGIAANLLSFVRVPNEKHTIMISALLDKTIELINLQGRLSNVEIIKNYGENTPGVNCFENKMLQVFLTLIINALDAMENRGTLTIETGMEEDNVYIKITDTGPGIPSEHIDRIFDPFFTTKPDKGGTGLGLAIASKIIKEHNGTIEAFSQEAKGTTFKITIPI